MTLEVFRDPSSVTVVGASADPAKWGWWLAQGSLLGRHRREVHLVNRRGTDVAGQSSLRCLSDVPGPLDLVALCVPPPAVPALVDEALDRGARGFVGITAGLGRDDERRLASLITDRGARLVGPSCLGLYDAATELQLAWGHFRAGRLAIVSQSGQVGSELANLAAERGVGVSRFVSLGSQVDVVAAEVLLDLVDQEATSVVALYLESFDDGPAVVAALHALAEAGKPTLVLTVGGSEAASSAARSHTGGLTSEFDVVDAACRVAGAVRVQTPHQLVEAAHLLVRAPRSRGDRVAVVGDSGGQGALAADVLGAEGLSVPLLGPDLHGDLARLLPEGAASANPVDLAGAGESDLGRYADLVERLVHSEEVDAVLLTGYFGCYAANSPSLEEREAHVAGRIAAAGVDKPVLVHSMADGSDVLALLEERGVPTFHTIDDAARALATERRLQEPRRVPSVAVGHAAPAAGYLAARELLTSCGVDFPAAVGVCSRDEVAAAAERLRPPYVLKADWIAHKTEHDAVKVGLPTAQTLVAAYDEMVGRLGTGAYVVEELDTRADVVEVIVGARRDPAFGPVALVGAGGTLAELLSDTALELAPVSLVTAYEMVDRLRVRALLDGWRGRPPVDRDALARVVCAVSTALAAAPPWVTEIELNPVRVGPSGAVAVDALVVGTYSEEDTA